MNALTALIEFTNAIDPRNQAELLDFSPHRLSELKYHAEMHIVSDIMHLRSEVDVKLYVRNTQTIIQKICSQAQNYFMITIEDPNQDLKVPEQYDALCDVLDSLTEFLRKKYPAFFDTDQNISITHARNKQIEYALLYQGLLSKYKNTDVDTQIIDIVAKPVLDFINGCTDFTYRNVDYFDTLFTELDTGNIIYNRVYEVISRNAEEIELQETEYNIRLHASLLYMNFNSRDYLAYISANLKRKLSHISNIADKEHFLHWYLRLLKQFINSNTLAYLNDEKSVSEYMKDWIKEELRYLKSLQPISSSGPAKTDKNPSSINKIKLEMSVKELALLLKTLYVSEIISNSQHVNEILRSVVAMCQTIGSDELNFDTLRGSYHVNSSTTTAKVQDKLHKLLNTLRTIKVK